MSKIRKAWGPIEACCVLERTARGWPHWHLLVRCGYIPQAWLSTTWCKLTGAFIVDIRQVHADDMAAKYVAKYITKAMAEPPDRRLGRVISFTRHYLPDKSLSPLSPYIWEIDRAVCWYDAREHFRSHYDEEPDANGWTYTPRAANRVDIAPSLPNNSYPPTPKYHVCLGPPPT